MSVPNCGRRLLRRQQMTLWFKQCARAVDGYSATNLLYPWTAFQSCAVGLIGVISLTNLNQI